MGSISFFFLGASGHGRTILVVRLSILAGEEFMAEAENVKFLIRKFLAINEFKSLT